MVVGEFTPECRKMLANAISLADTYGHDYMDTEHLLAAMVTTDCGGADILRDALGLTAEDVAWSLTPYLPNNRQEGDKHSRSIAWNPQAKRAYEYALRASLELNHTRVGTETMLIGMMRVGGCPAVEALQSLHVTAVEVEGVTRNYIRMATVQGRKPSPR